MSEVKTMIQGLSDTFGQLSPRISKMDDEMRSIKSAVAALQTASAKTPDMMGAQGVSEGFKSFVGDLRQRKSIENKDFTVAAVENPPSGGYTVTPDYVNRIFERHYNESPLMQHAEVIDVTSNTAELYYETDDGEGNWVGELETRTGTVGGIGKATIPVHEYTFPITVSMQLLEDSDIANIQNYLTSRATRHMTRAIGDAFVTGDGFKKPEGVFASPILETIPSGNATDITLDALIDAMGAIPNDYDASAKWFMSKKTFLEIYKAYATENTWINLPLSNGFSPSILGHDVVFVNAPELAAGSTSIIYGDMHSAYKIVRRLAINTMVDYNTGWRQGVVYINNRVRMGGQLLMPEAIVGIKTGAS